MCAASVPVLQLCAEGACAILSAATPAVRCVLGSVYRLLSLLSLLLFMRMFGLCRYLSVATLAAPAALALALFLMKADSCEV